MQINRTNGTNFTGVIPVRVLQDGKEVRDKELIKKTCHAVIKGIAGPLPQKQEFKTTAALLSTMDSEYKYPIAYLGYTRDLPNEQVSQFFKTIFDKSDRGYIVTGKASEILSERGKAIGIATRQVYLGNVSPSEIANAENNYWEAYHTIVNNMALRIREAFSPYGQKLGKYQQMDVQITTKPHKVKGKEDLKVILDKISFSERNQG